MARDIIHKAVKNALINDRWIITADPLYLKYDTTETFVDLAAEQPIAAERNGRKIAVEIKSFVGRSAIQDLEVALGQYQTYLALLEVLEPDRELFLAISESVHRTVFALKAAQLIVTRFQIKLLIVNLEREEVISWINPKSIDA